MANLDVTQHALKRFREQATHPADRELNDEQIRGRILKWWQMGEPQTARQIGWAIKFQRYGIENSEHRIFQQCVLTRVDETIVTVHFKTPEEHRRQQKQRRKHESWLRQLMRRR